ncbi:MAG: hypothetical protein C4297_11700 [Gemmataceae bacterium]
MKKYLVTAWTVILLTGWFLAVPEHLAAGPRRIPTGVCHGITRKPTGVKPRVKKSTPSDPTWDTEYCLVLVKRPGKEWEVHSMHSWAIPAIVNCLATKLSHPDWEVRIVNLNLPHAIAIILLVLIPGIIEGAWSSQSKST